MNDLSRRIELPEEKIKQTSSGAKKIQLSEQDISRFRSLVSAPVKGFLKELPSLTKLANPISYLLPDTGENKLHEKTLSKFSARRFAILSS